MAICFECGLEKARALLACAECGTTPRSNEDLSLSLVLTEHLSTKAQLAHYRHEIQNHLVLSVPHEALTRAQDVLKDPQLSAALGAQSATNAKFSSAPVQRTLKTTALHQTPFAILGVTTRDDRRRIVELAEERSLNLDHDVCQKARSDLTNPRTRLGAEIAWLPGVSPRRAAQVVENLLYDPMAVREESGLPTLAHLNLLAAAFEAVDSEHDADDLASFIQEVAYLVDEIDPEDVLRDINEDRAVSGFPEVRALDQIEAQLAERKWYYRSAIKAALDRLPPTTLVQVMTDTVEGVTLGGEDHAPELIDDLVDSYEVETQGFLQKEAENVHKLIKDTRDSANSGKAAVKPYVDKLDAVARNWDKVAQPIQLSAKARGIDHKASLQLAYAIRSLAIDLFNTYDMLTHSQRLTVLLQDLFAELPEVSARVDQDAGALKDIASDRDQLSKLARKFVDFNLSGDEFSWKGRTYNIRSIDHIAFSRSITTHKTNFVETGKTERAILSLTFNSGKTLNIDIDEQGVFFNRNKTKKIQLLAEFYSFLLRITFERRVNFYEDQLEQNGYFVYDECHFYPHDKIVFRGKDFHVDTSSFFRSYGSIEMRKKDFGVLDRIKRGVSLTKSPQFCTLTDTDVIFHLLQEHMGLTWKS